MSTNEREALRTCVIVGKDGHIDVPRVDLPEGTEAELVIVVKMPDNDADKPSILDMFGMLRGTYGTAAEIDTAIQAERDSWD